MANMVNMNNLLNGKDSRWLQLEVCREFQRNKCTRPDTECKFAHPPTNVEVLNGRVTACYDSIKGRCNRDKPPCKYFHPPQHLKDQLLINGRNHLALKNALLHQMGLASGQPLVPGQVPTVATTPYLTGMPQVNSTFSPYFSPAPMMPTLVAQDPTGSLGMVQQTVVAATTAQQKMARSDRLEPSTAATSMSLAASPIELAGRKRTRNPSDDLLMMDMKAVGQLYYDNFAFPGMAYKRAAGDKSGVPMYQPGATATYQQLLQPFVPVSCEYRLPLAAAGNMAAFTTGVALNKAPTVTVPATPSHPQQFLRYPTPSAQSQFALPTLPSQSISNFLAAAQLNASTATTNNNNNNDEDSQLVPFKKMKTT
ncbi:muscleblind-like protein isoform X2 [Bemisia tabaci]|uniref:muscleblind-like protein isoform X2 n=1 Tax=Bemisia tabaci TaxID=7038 RepID=UPI0008F98495|nr:PREDICTED: muscleblind-like protein isoform X2 [Bemisia tabaci]